MGRLDEFAVQREIIRTIVISNMRGIITIRQMIMQRVTEDLGISERSFAKAYAQIDKAGILIKNHVDVFTRELNVRGERRKSFRYRLFIDIKEAVTRAAELWSESIVSKLKDYPEETREFLFERYRKVRGQTLLEEVDIAMEALKRWGKYKTSPLTAGESIYLNVFVHMVMEYLRALREKNKMA